MSKKGGDMKKLIFIFLWGVSVVNSSTNIILKACPDTPNCISSLAKTASVYIAPLSLKNPQLDPKQTLKTLLAEQPRWLLLTETDDYLHYQVTSWLFRFKDDVEFKIDLKNQQSHFRSASRLGISDFGANRKRMEHIRVLWQQLQQLQQ